MKFSLFVHMERYDAATPHRRLFRRLTELVQIAEKGGFETAWVGEHHAMEFTIAPNPFINLFLPRGAYRTDPARDWHGNRAFLASHPSRGRGRHGRRREQWPA